MNDQNENDQRTSQGERLNGKGNICGWELFRANIFMMNVKQNKDFIKQPKNSANNKKYSKNGKKSIFFIYY